MMNFQNLKSFAASQGITIAEISKAVGMSSTAFKKLIETGTFPIGKVGLLCQVLGISTAEFFGEVGKSVSMSDIRLNKIIKGMVNHISWLETEIDDLRYSQQEKRDCMRIKMTNS